MSREIFSIIRSHRVLSTSQIVEISGLERDTVIEELKSLKSSGDIWMNLIAECPECGISLRIYEEWMIDEKLLCEFCGKDVYISKHNIHAYFFVP